MPNGTLGDVMWANVCLNGYGYSNWHMLLSKATYKKKPHYKSDKYINIKKTLEIR